MLKWVGRISFLVALAAFLAMFGLYNNYLHILPRSPDQITGRVYPVNDHGIIVYQNREERRTLLLVQYTAFSSLAVSAVVSVLHQGRNRTLLRPGT